MMRLLAALLALLTGAWLAQVPAGGGGGGGCCTLVNHISGVSANSPSAATLSVTGGNLLVVGAEHDGPTANSISCSDTAGNTFTAAKTASGFDSGGATGVVTIFYAKNVTGNASDTVSCSDSAGASVARAIIIHQYSGASTTAPLDATANGFNFGGTSVTSGSFSTVTAKEALVVMTGFTTATGTCSAGTAGYSQIDLDANSRLCSLQDLVTTTQSAVTATTNWSTNGNFATVVGTFQ